jgi:ABC-type transport system involved in cytochrome bd biosynthesis fused ATPase/permease subunit
MPLVLTVVSMSICCLVFVQCMCLLEYLCVSLLLIPLLIRESYTETTEDQSKGRNRLTTDFFSLVTNEEAQGRKY